jgi:hypothetical protein
MYRDANYAASCRNVGQMSENLSPELSRIAASRGARVIAGLVGLVGFACVIAMVVVLAVRGIGAMRLWRSGGAPSWLLLAVWPSMLGAGLLVYTWLRAWPTRGPRAPRSSEQDALTTALLRDSRATLRWQIDRLAAVEGRSLALLGAATALLAPLTSHLFFAMLIGQPAFRMRNFDGYMGIALACTWLPHLVVAVGAWRYFRRAQEQLAEGGDPHPVVTGLSHSGIAAVSTTVSLAVACAVSNLPFIFAVVVAAVVVFITGLVYLPLTYWVGTLWLKQERATIEAMVADASPPSAATLRE